jgi:hypothetical protein
MNEAEVNKSMENIFDNRSSIGRIVFEDFLAQQTNSNGSRRRRNAEQRNSSDLEDLFDLGENIFFLFIRIETMNSMSSRSPLFLLDLLNRRSSKGKTMFKGKEISFLFSHLEHRSFCPIDLFSLLVVSGRMIRLRKILSLHSGKRVGKRLFRLPTSNENQQKIEEREGAREGVIRCFPRE